MSKIFYKIEIPADGWAKYNHKAKKGHPCIMLSKRFLDDRKIQSLPAGGKLLYLGLLLRRGDVDTTFIEPSHEDLVRLAGGSGQVVSRLLDQLQSLQLLTYDKIEPLNIKEKNIKEYKRKEEKVIEKPTSSDPDSISEIIVLSPKEIVADLVLDYWNSFSSLPKAKKLSSGRKSKIGNRLKQEDFRTGWRNIISTISQTPFLIGQNDRGWRASFDWFIANDENYLKVIEGFYAANQPKKAMSSAQKIFEGLSDQARRVAAGEL